MNYEEALKKFKAEKAHKEHFMIVTLDARLVLPYMQGIALLAALNNAEKLPRYWSDKQTITPLESGAVQTEMMSRQSYECHKVAALMGMKPEDLRKLLEERENQTTETT